MNIIKKNFHLILDINKNILSGMLMQSNWYHVGDIHVWELLKKYTWIKII